MGPHILNLLSTGSLQTHKRFIMSQIRAHPYIQKNYIHVYIYCITPLAWVEIQCFALTAYMLTRLHAYMLTSLHAYMLTRLHAYKLTCMCVHVYTLRHGYVSTCDPKAPCWSLTHGALGPAAAPNQESSLRQRPTWSTSARLSADVDHAGR